MKLLASIEVVVSLGIADVAVPLECLGATSYADRLVFWFVAPFVGIGSIFVLSLLTVVASEVSSE